MEAVMTRPSRTHSTERNDPLQIDSAELLRACAEDKDNSELWSEFLRRFTARIKTFIRGTLRQYMGGAPSASDFLVFFGSAQEADLLQNTILRLVENNCAAIKRFSGTTEEELVAYLAVITRSTVRDYLRRLRARKRFPWQRFIASRDSDLTSACDSSKTASELAIERGVLARELTELSMNIIRNSSGEYYARDLLIFQLYFAHDLSIAQIAECKGIGLSRTGVEKALNRLKDRVRSAVATASNQTVEL
jgi:RNA polymerase sigma factor (sigma-70 family)